MQCTKLCSEPCDRELCEHPNLELLPCEHPSIGVCGEKMPKLCRICNKDKVEEIFFGDEDEPDARFIQLEDCKNCIIEVKGLIGWMTSEPESDESNPNANNRNSIQVKKCPKCNTVIRHTKSLNTFIQAGLRDIQQVKIKTCGDPEVNKATQRILCEKVEITLMNISFVNDPLNLKLIYEDLLKKTEFKKGEIFAKPNQTLVQLNNKFELVETLRKIWAAFYGRQTFYKNLCTEELEKFESRLRMAASFIR